MEEFFGINGYAREAEGFLSFQHLLFVTAVMAVMVSLAVFFGRRNKNRSEKEKNRVLVWAAILIDAFELFKIVFLCFRSHDPMNWLYNLPLFLCSIMLIAIPLAAFSKGPVKEASLDFVLIFGLLAAVLGTYGAGNNYGSYPVLCFDNVVSAITHAISGFTSLYVGITGMAKLRRKMIPATFLILLGFCAAAYAADLLIPYNYMFLIRGDGTPYEIFYSLVGGSPVLYPLTVVALFLLYISAFYLVRFLMLKRKKEKTETKDGEETA
ncbi:MAG: YwaF family protein [Clostridia bacterium]|nr:YwaF family protein [Clostridia bacterium]